MYEYDVIVIGAGQGGIPFAREAAGSGRKTALIEREHVGGTCINVGCTPTKTMIASARVAHLARRAADYGVDTGEVQVNMTRVRQRKQEIVESWRASGESGIEATPGLDLIRGSARFVGAHSLAVQTPDEEVRLTAPIIVIDAGTRPAIPDLPGLGEVPYLTSTSILELEEVPEHLVILGGGYVAVEFAQMFRRFGSLVTLVVRGTRLLSQEDEDISEGVAQILREDGVEILTEAAVASTGRAEEARVELQVDAAVGPKVLDASHLLLALGRVPNTEDLELDEAGVELDRRGFIPVNDRLETAVPGIFAIGDVTGRAAFTHVSYDDYRILKANLLNAGAESTKGRVLPYAVFVDPQLGRVGLSESRARELGYEVIVGRLPMSSVARALEMDEARGFMKVVVDAKTDQILGAAVLGVEGGEVVAVLQAAMLGGITASVLRETMFAHPTLAEAMNNLFASLPSSVRG